MSDNFKKKTSEVLERGKAERGNFEPHGAPLRVYKYWLRNSTGSKAAAIKLGKRRENFCHFWRVVAIWAPLLWLLRKGEAVVTTKTFVGLVAAVLVGLVVWAGFTSASFLAVLGWIALALLAAAVVVGIILGIVWLKRKYWKSEWNDRAGKIAFGVWVTIMTVYLGSMLVIGFIEIGWMLLVYIVGGLIALVAVVVGLSKLSDYISGKRAIAKAKRKAEEEAAWDAYYSGGPHPYKKAKKYREPGKISKFFSGLGDFLIFAFQIVRVKKWKICPMVDVDVNR